MTDDRIVQNDFSCIACGYNLRGCRYAGNCPECDKPVMATLDASVFGMVVPAQQRHVARVLIGVAAALFVLTIVFSWLFSEAHATRIGPIDLYARLGQGTILLCGLTALVAIVWAFRQRTRAAWIAALVCAAIFSVTIFQMPAG